MCSSDISASETYRALRQLQLTMARRVRLESLRRQPRLVAGLDAAYLGGQIIAAAVLVDLETLAVVDRSVVVALPAIPYIPGLLAFREGPHLTEAVRALSRQPDLLIVDGQGIAHPKRFGLACYVGVELDLPAIGSAKSRLVGEYAEPAAERGSRTPLIDRGETVGIVLRSRSHVRPLFVSPGHLITLDEAVVLILRVTKGYRLPEPQRAADRLAGETKRALAASR